jgi:hypothetical protein
VTSIDAPNGEFSPLPGWPFLESCTGGACFPTTELIFILSLLFHIFSSQSNQFCAEFAFLSGTERHSFHNPKTSPSVNCLPFAAVKHSFNVGRVCSQSSGSSSPITILTKLPHTPLLCSIFFQFSRAPIKPPKMPESVSKPHQSRILPRESQILPPFLLSDFNCRHNFVGGPLSLPSSDIVRFHRPTPTRKAEEPRRTIGGVILRLSLSKQQRRRPFCEGGQKEGRGVGGETHRQSKRAKGVGGKPDGSKERTSDKAADIADGKKKE